MLPSGCSRWARSRSRARRADAAGTLARPRRILRAIARLNLGGPAHHVAILSGRMDTARWETLLVSGRVGPGEEELAERYGARHAYIEGLGPELHPARDLRALRGMARVVRRFRPDVIHSHTAKAGAIARAAALSVRPRPVVVHTYHGHVLEGYFGPARNAAYRATERALARVSDRLIGVSERTVEDLVRLGVAPRERFVAIPLGLELDRFTAPAQSEGAELRTALDAAEGDLVVCFVGRLVPIKRVDLALRAVARARAGGARVRLAVVGDGELRAELEALAASLGLADAVRFLGYRSDLETVYAAADAALLTSANEGTPVSLIEAGAAGLPAVATDVGGVAEVVGEGCGFVVPAGDEAALAEAIGRIAGDSGLRARMGAAARERMLSRYRAERLVADVEALYEELLERR